LARHAVFDIHIDVDEIGRAWDGRRLELYFLHVRQTLDALLGALNGDIR
jgi:hypothetical protein